jgi:hypothetical protein
MKKAALILFLTLPLLLAGCATRLNPFGNDEPELGTYTVIWCPPDAPEECVEFTTGSELDAAALMETIVLLYLQRIGMITTPAPEANINSSSIAPGMITPTQPAVQTNRVVTGTNRVLLEKDFKEPE